MRHALVLTAIGAVMVSAPAHASCNAATPSSLQSNYPALGVSTAAALAPALSDVAALAAAEGGARSAAMNRDQRIEQLSRQVAEYDARRQAQRAPLNFRSREGFLRSMLQGGTPDPPYIASARAELKAARRNQRQGAAGNGERALIDADGELASALDRLTQEASSGGSYRMLLDADRLVRERVADCAAWRSAGGAALPRSLAALDRHDQALRGALTTAAAAVAPRARAEIAGATDSATLDRLNREYMPSPAAAAAMEGTGVAQALAARQASIGSRERAASAAAQGQRDAEAARAARVRAAEQARADAAERALLARQRTAQGSSRAVGNGGGGSTSGEPSETQMRNALQANAGMVANRFGMGDWTKISYFEKVGCEKAQGRIGWQCDYLVRMDGNPMSGLMDALAGPNTAMRGSARFVLRGNGWDAFPEQSRD